MACSSGRKIRGYYRSIGCRYEEAKGVVAPRRGTCTTNTLIQQYGPEDTLLIAAKRADDDEEARSKVRDAEGLERDFFVQ